MPKFYYQIKGKDKSEYGSGRWDWPPLLSGMVQSEDKKGARALIDEEYGRKFPLRVLRKDMDSEHYLLHIREVGEDDEKTLRLFEPIACKECETKFRIIDKYNDANEHNKGAEFCSSKCAKDYRERSSYRTPSELDGSGTAVIYKIANVKTRMVYIGKTTQAFTLRWYQHFYQNGDCKFHEAIKNSELTDLNQMRKNMDWEAFKQQIDEALASRGIKSDEVAIDSIDVSMPDEGCLKINVTQGSDDRIEITVSN